MSKALFCMILSVITLSGCAGSTSSTQAPAGAAQASGSQPYAAPGSPPTAAAVVTAEGAQAAAATAPTATPTPLLQPAGPGGACSNPYYPVADGATWNYTFSSGDKAVHTMTVGGDGTFTMNVQGENVATTVDGLCTNEGIALMNVGGLSINLTDGSQNSKLSTDQAEGVTLPNDVQVGDEWSQVINASGSSDASTAVTTNYQALAIEDVTVPAGTFHALKVLQSSTVSFAGNPIDTQQYIWYAPGVGVVKTEMQDVYTSELVSYTIP